MPLIIQSISAYAMGEFMRFTVIYFNCKSLVYKELESTALFSPKSLCYKGLVQIFAAIDYTDFKPDNI